MSKPFNHVFVTACEIIIKRGFTRVCGIYNKQYMVLELCEAKIELSSRIINQKSCTNAVYKSTHSI